MKGEPIMHTTRILLLCGLLTCASVQAGTYEWTSVRIPR